MFSPFASLAIRFLAFMTETLREKLARCEKGKVRWNKTKLWKKKKRLGFWDSDSSASPFDVHMAAKPQVYRRAAPFFFFFHFVRVHLKGLKKKNYLKLKQDSTWVTALPSHVFSSVPDLQLWLCGAAHNKIFVLLCILSTSQGNGLNKWTTFFFFTC